MPINRFRLVFTFILLLACNTKSWADMPPISDEDQKLTAVPGQPGAAAAVLYREEVYDDIRHAARIQARIKILTEKGREYADVSLPYNRKDFELAAISGRTIHPDGKVIPFEGKPFEKTIFKTKSISRKVKTFTLPDVQPGSIIEYKYTLIYPEHELFAPRWVVQDDLWQKQVHFRFYMYPKDVQMDHDQIARGISWTIRMPKGMEPKQVTLPNGEVYVELNANNIEPFIKEPYMPDSDQFKFNVHFYYRNGDPKDYWKNATKFWDQDANKFMNKKNGVADIVAKITAPTDTPEQKVRKIYAFVIGLDNEDYLTSRTEQEIKTLNVKAIVGVEDVLRQKRGDPQDLTRTFVALVRAAGLKAYLMELTSRENNFFDGAYLDWHQFDSEIAIVEIDGKDVLLDPGAKFSAYGVLDWRHTMCGGYRQTANKPEFFQTPAPTYKDATIRRAARFTIKPDFTVDGPINVKYSGFYATMHRQSAANADAEGRKKILEDEVKSWLPADSEVTLVSTPNWSDVETDLSADFRVSATLASNAGKRVLLPANAFHFSQPAMFPHAERVNGVYLYYPSRETDEITLIVPPTLAVDSVPLKDAVKLPYAVYATQYVGNGNNITIVRDLANNEFIFDKAAYAEVKGFYDKVKAGDEQQIILRSAANAASGN